MKYTPLNRRNAFGALFGIVLVAGCAGGDNSSAAAPPVVRDSASITIVENSSPAWRGDEGWSLSEEPVTVIGMTDGPREYLFQDVMGILVQSDGTIVVGDMASSQLRFFDSAGKHLRTVSRKGEGPGEIGQLMAIARTMGDTILVRDGRPMLHVFDGSGGYVTSISADPGESLHPPPMGYTTDGRIYFLLQGNYPQRTADPVQLENTLALKRLSDTAFDSILSVRSEIFYPGWRGTPTRMLFGPRVQIATLSDGIVKASGDRFEFVHYDLEGQVRRIVRRAWQPDAVPEGLSERYAEAYVATAGERGGPVPESLQRQRREIHDATPVATTLPPFTRILSDPDDNLWVRETDAEHLVLPQQGWNTFEPVPSRWNIFDREGIWLGTVETPANFIVRDIGRTYIAGLTRDDLGVEMVNVYALTK